MPIQLLIMLRTLMSSISSQRDSRQMASLSNAQHVTVATAPHSNAPHVTMATVPRSNAPHVSVATVPHSNAPHVSVATVPRSNEQQEVQEQMEEQPQTPIVDLHMAPDQSTTEIPFPEERDEEAVLRRSMSSGYESVTSTFPVSSVKTSASEERETRAQSSATIPAPSESRCSTSSEMDPEYNASLPAPEEELEEEDDDEEEEVEREEEEEMYPQTALNTPIGALRKSRRRLCLMLNVEMIIPDSQTGLCPDYRGLAELVGFEALEITNFWERNPSDTLFLEWARDPESKLQPAVLATLVSCLGSLGRQDVLQECRGLILQDVSDYLAEQKLLKDHSANRLEKYDCYVNIADADILTVGREILDILEGAYRLRLCLTLRDIPLGGWEYETMATILETRCDSKVLLVLTKNYEDSEACQFLMQFATTLDPCSHKNKLIPLVVDEGVNIPRVIRSRAALNFNRDKELGYLWPRLKHAITR